MLLGIVGCVTPSCPNPALLRCWQSFLGVMGMQHQAGGIHHFKGTGSGADKYYCARRLGVALIPGSDGQCGPNNGPQCAECRAYQAAQVSRLSAN